MSPPQKSNFANVQNANALVSIHVNAADKNEMPNSGMEVVLSKKNLNVFGNSKRLGSAIIQNLQPDFFITPALIQKQVGIWILDNANLPSVLVECGYITNANDAKMLRQDDKIELIAKNVLQGVALYANNGVDESKLYKIENKDSDTSVPVRANTMLKEQQTPLYVLDGKMITETAFKKIDVNTIESINVLKDKSATDKYGEKSKYGVIEITLKNGTRSANDSLTQRFLLNENSESITDEKGNKLTTE